MPAVCLNSRLRQGGGIDAVIVFPVCLFVKYSVVLV